MLPFANRSDPFREIYIPLRTLDDPRVFEEIPRIRPLLRIPNEATRSRLALLSVRDLSDTYHCDKKL
jgi:hypothetical protein